MGRKDKLHKEIFRRTKGRRRGWQNNLGHILLNLGLYVGFFPRKYGTLLGT